MFFPEPLLPVLLSSWSLWGLGLVTVSPAPRAAVVRVHSAVAWGWGQAGSRKEGDGEEGPPQEGRRGPAHCTLGGCESGHHPPCEFQPGWGSRRSQGWRYREAVIGKTGLRMPLPYFFVLTPPRPTNACPALGYFTGPEDLGALPASQVASPPLSPRRIYWGQLCHNFASRWPHLMLSNRDLQHQSALAPRKG